MIGNILIVAAQVAILFILIAVGFICGKTNLIAESGAKYLTDVVLYLATPCVMIQAFQKAEFTPEIILNLGVAALCAVLIHILTILVVRLMFKKQSENRRKVMRFAVIFSNCGFMSLPLQQALLGDSGVLYGSVFVAVFNIIVWSYGLADMSGDKKCLTLKKIILNPGLLGAFAAVLFFFLRIHLPEILMSPVGYLAGLNTPVPMLVIGYHLSQADLLKSLRDKGIYAVAFMRLALVPCVSLLIMSLCGVSGDILVSCTIAASAPVAATTTMFATKFDRDVDLSVGLVSVTTIFSIITMPVIIALSQTI
jgi:predicted permease